MATRTHTLSGNETYLGAPFSPDDDFIITDNGGAGGNTVTLGNGTDNLTLLNGNNTVTLGNGPDQITAGSGNNTLTTGNGNSHITVGDGNDTITVGTGSNTIALGTGIAPRTGNNTVHTGAGGNTVFDTAAAIGAVSGDTILGALTNGDGTTNRLVLTTAGVMSPINVSGFQSYQLSNGGANSLTLVDANFARLPGALITVIGGDSGNTVNASTLSAAHAVNISSGAGADKFTGGAGSDTVTYAGAARAVIIDLSAQSTWDGVVNDTVIGIENAVGSPFADRIWGTSGDNVLDGGGGSNTVLGGDGNDTLISGSGAEYLDGGAGNDTLSYANSASGVIVDLPSQSTWDGTVHDTVLNFENTIGSPFDDVFYSTYGANRFDGGAGNDMVTYAGAGRAVIVDLANQSTFDGVVTDTLSSIESAVGSPFADRLLGSSGDDRLDGGPGANTVLAGDGNDTLISGSGAEYLDGGPGNDTVSYANSLRPVIVDLPSGSSWDGQVNDALVSIENVIGSSFNDDLRAGAGPAILTGGPGNDTFVFQRGQAGGDSVTDFAGAGQAGGDQLSFTGYGTTAQGASFTQLDATHWSINSADGLVHDHITLTNGASVSPGDFQFS